MTTAMSKLWVISRTRKEKLKLVRSAIMPIKGAVTTNPRRKVRDFRDRMLARS